MDSRHSDFCAPARAGFYRPHFWAICILLPVTLVHNADTELSGSSGRAIFIVALMNAFFIPYRTGVLGMAFPINPALWSLWDEWVTNILYAAGMLSDEIARDCYRQCGFIGVRAVVRVEVWKVECRSVVHLASAKHLSCAGGIHCRTSDPSGAQVGLAKNPASGAALMDLCGMARGLGQSANGSQARLRTHSRHRGCTTGDCRAGSGRAAGGADFPLARGCVLSTLCFTSGRAVTRLGESSYTSDLVRAPCSQYRSLCWPSLWRRSSFA